MEASAAATATAITNTTYFSRIDSSRGNNITNDTIISKYNIGSRIQRQYISLPTSDQTNIFVDNMNKNDISVVKNVGFKTGESNYGTNYFKEDVTSYPSGYTLQGVVVRNNTNTTIYHKDTVASGVDIHYIVDGKQYRKNL